MHTQEQIAIGDRVMYSARFLRSIGAYTGDLGLARGVVVALKPVGRLVLASVDWHDDDIPRYVHAGNLWPVGKPEPWD